MNGVRIPSLDQAFADRPAGRPGQGRHARSTEER